MRILNLDFWTKPEIKYFQNNLILEDIPFLDGEEKIIK